MNTKLNDIIVGNIHDSTNGGKFKIVEVGSYSSKGIIIEFLDKHKYSTRVSARLFADYENIDSDYHALKDAYQLVLQYNTVCTDKRLKKLAKQN